MGKPDFTLDVGGEEVAFFLTRIVHSDKVAPHTREGCKHVLELAIEKIESMEAFEDEKFLKDRDTYLHMAVVLRDLLYRI
jgi:hypothetical protein